MIFIDRFVANADLYQWKDFKIVQYMVEDVDKFSDINIWGAVGL